MSGVWWDVLQGIVYLGAVIFLLLVLLPKLIDAMVIEHDDCPDYGWLKTSASDWYPGADIGNGGQDDR